MNLSFDELILFYCLPPSASTETHGFGVFFISPVTEVKPCFSRHGLIKISGHEIWDRIKINFHGAMTKMPDYSTISELSIVK